MNIYRPLAIVVVLGVLTGCGGAPAQNTTPDKSLSATAPLTPGNRDPLNQYGVYVGELNLWVHNHKEWASTNWPNPVWKIVASKNAEPVFTGENVFGLNGIIGFTYEQAYTYMLRVREFKYDPRPSDGPSNYFVLLSVEEKLPSLPGDVFQFTIPKQAWPYTFTRQNEFSFLFGDSEFECLPAACDAIEAQLAQPGVYSVVADAEFTAISPAHMIVVGVNRVLSK